MEPTALTHLSRHSLLAQAERVAWLPFPPAGPPDERTGVSTAHRLFVVGMFVEDMQVCGDVPCVLKRPLKAAQALSARRYTVGR